MPVAVFVLHPYRHRYDLISEPAGLTGRQRLQVAVQREGVLILARDPVTPGDRLGGRPHRVVRTRPRLQERAVGGEVVSAHRYAAGDVTLNGKHHEVHALGDRVYTLHDRLQASGEEAVDRPSGDVVGQYGDLISQ